MEEFAKQLLDFAEGLTTMVDEFFHELTDASEIWEEEGQGSLLTDMEACLQELFEPIVSLCTELDQVITGVELGYPVEPNGDRHPACIGCCHYHGQVYNGQLLVCGMHPYGWDGEHCPDWQG
jgi:hypothetical protein